MRSLLLSTVALALLSAPATAQGFEIDDGSGMGHLSGGLHVLRFEDDGDEFQLNGRQFGFDYGYRGLLASVEYRSSTYGDDTDDFTVYDLTYSLGYRALPELLLAVGQRRLELEIGGLTDEVTLNEAVLQYDWTRFANTVTGAAVHRWSDDTEDSTTYYAGLSFGIAADIGASYETFSDGEDGRYYLAGSLTYNEAAGRMFLTGVTGEDEAVIGARGRFAVLPQIADGNLYSYVNLQHYLDDDVDLTSAVAGLGFRLGDVAYVEGGLGRLVGDSDSAMLHFGLRYDMGEHSRYDLRFEQERFKDRQNGLLSTFDAPF